MLVDGGTLTLRPLHEGAATARWRSSKTRQRRIQFRYTPGEFGPTVYLRDLRDLSRCVCFQLIFLYLGDLSSARSEAASKL